MALQENSQDALSLVLVLKTNPNTDKNHFQDKPQANEKQLGENIVLMNNFFNILLNFFYLLWFIIKHLRYSSYIR